MRGSKLTSMFARRFVQQRIQRTTRFSASAGAPTHPGHVNSTSKQTGKMRFFKYQPVQNYPGHKKAKKVPIVDFLEIQLKKKIQKRRITSSKSKLHFRSIKQSTQKRINWTPRECRCTRERFFKIPDCIKNQLFHTLAII